MCGAVRETIHHSKADRMPFTTRRRVEFVDTDMAGIVHFSNFFRFMEAAEQEFLRSLGFGVSFTWEGEALGFPRVSATCDYLRPARFEDVLDVHVSVEKVGRKSVTYRFDFLLHGEAVARGRVSAVCCRVVRHHELVSVEIPAVIRAKLEASV
jgi:YbgC/YbaW family acyl-CoA thioester hydrolase